MMLYVEFDDHTMSVVIQFLRESGFAPEDAIRKLKHDGEKGIQRRKDGRFLVKKQLGKHKSQIVPTLWDALQHQMQNAPNGDCNGEGAEDPAMDMENAANGDGNGEGAGDPPVLPDLEILSAVIVIGVSDLVLPTALLHLVTAGVRHISPHHPVPVLEAPLVFLPSTASQCLLHPVPGRFDRVRLRVVTQELEHKSNKTQEGQSPSSYPLQLPAGNYVHLNLVSQLFCAENRENLPNECDAEEDSQQYVHDPERR